MQVRVWRRGVTRPFSKLLRLDGAIPVSRQSARRDIPELGVDIPADLRSLIRRWLAVDPDDRGTAVEAIAALDGAPRSQGRA